MKMGVIAAVFAASLFATPVFAANVAESSSAASVGGGSAGNGSAFATASDKGAAESGQIFGVGEATSSNTATGVDITHGFAFGDFNATGQSFAGEASHF